MSLFTNKSVTRRVRLSHRNGGVVLSVFLLLFVVTGILLNHTDDLGLAERSVPALIAERYYDVEPVSGFVVDGVSFYRLGETVYMDRVPVSICTGELAGAAVAMGGFAVLCGGELIVVSSQGELIERLGVAHGLPAGISAVAGAGDDLLRVRVDDEVFTLSLMTLELQPAGGGSSFAERAPIARDVLLDETVSWEQFLLDLHSGKYLGQVGVWLWDLIGLFMLVLADFRHLRVHGAAPQRLPRETIVLRQSPARYTPMPTFSQRRARWN